MSTAVNNHRAGAREWLGLAVLALPTLLLSIDVSVLHLAVPHIGASLGPSAAEMLWIIDIYGFMIAGLLVTMGTLGDRIGRRKLLLLGAAAFAATSVLAAYSTDPTMLIAARALLGISGATLMPSTLALISNMFRDPAQRGFAIAVWVTMFSVGIAIGPVVGGAMLQLFWWGSVFLLAVPIMVLLLVSGPVLLPEYRNEEAGRLDLLSVVLSLATLLPVIFGLKELATVGVGPLPFVAIAVGLAFGILFVRRQRAIPSPMLDLDLLRNRTFAVALVTLLVTMLIAGGTYLFVTQYLQLVQSLSPMRAGLWLLPAAFGLIITSMIAPAVAQRIGPSYVVSIGLTVSAAGHLMLMLVDSTGSFTQLVVGFALTYAGGGPVVALGTDLVVGSAPPEQAGSASAMSETSTELGMALGVATLGSVGTAVYRGLVEVPGDVPAEVAGAARDTLAGAVAAARDLPSETATALLGPARDAFTTGLNVIGGISTALALALAVAVVAAIRGGSAQADEAEQAAPAERAEEVGEPVAEQSA